MHDKNLSYKDEFPRGTTSFPLRSFSKAGLIYWALLTDVRCSSQSSGVIAPSTLVFLYY